MSDLANKIDACLPQTQCTECGYDACRPYAEALADGDATPDLCPPGGVKTLGALGKLLNIDVAVYSTTVEENTRPPSTVVIREHECIGCTKCIQACPVDAIIGSAKHMHTVLTSECTGCGLCIPACPVDCIDNVELNEISYDPERSRQRYQQRQSRLSKKEKVKKTANQNAKKDYILQAMQRAKQKKEVSA